MASLPHRGRRQPPAATGTAHCETWRRGPLPLVAAAHTRVEVTRVATDGTRNANSLLYAATWRAARARGYRRLVTYTRKVVSSRFPKC
ncbi:XF1762 family protein [Micromonospora craniellae]|uniref:XF1762 family protein n=1 Tax=Micromonospora craniellae TaxID=2294034 RepID=UPI002D77B04C|nr:XF1762 family protein [Micromonospora craniellae]